MEIWKDVENFEGIYQVSNLGSVKRINRRGKLKTLMLKAFKDKNDYCYINIKIEGRTKHRLIHRLVTKAFIPNPFNKTDTNHKDNNPLNNNVENLEWCTKKENIQYAAKQGRIRNRFTGKLIMKGGDNIDKSTENH